MNEPTIMAQLHELLTSGRTQAAVNLIEAEMRTTRIVERSAASHLSALHGLFNEGSDVQGTLTDFADWVVRMKAIDDPEFVDELLSLLDYGRSRAAMSGTLGESMVKRFSRATLVIMPDDEDDDQN